VIIKCKITLFLKRASEKNSNETDKLGGCGSKSCDPFCGDISIPLWTEDALPCLMERHTATN